MAYVLADDSERLYEAIWKKKSPPSLSMKTSAVEGKSSELSPWYHFPNLLIKYPLAFGDLKLTHTQI